MVHMNWNAAQLEYGLGKDAMTDQFYCLRREARWSEAL
jgi:hypothetical protein